MNPLQTAGAMLRHKLSGEAYTPDKFRVGMTMGFDPTPFLLAGDATKVAAPAPDAGSTRLSIDEVGQLSGQGVSLTRLYLPERRGYFQLHLDSAGNPDECRYFTPIDAITPADPNEWGAWLDPNEGMIGWPQFQTKDGKLYDRVWASGLGPHAAGAPGDGPKPCRAPAPAGSSRCCMPRRLASPPPRRPPNTSWCPPSRNQAAPGSKSPPASTSTRPCWRWPEHGAAAIPGAAFRQPPSLRRHKMPRPPTQPET